jgi:hypothetical protein
LHALCQLPVPGREALSQLHDVIAWIAGHLRIVTTDQPPLERTDAKVVGDRFVIPTRVLPGQELPELVPALLE